MGCVMCECVMAYESRYIGDLATAATAATADVEKVMRVMAHV